MYGLNMLMKQSVRGSQVCPWGCCDPAHGQKKKARRTMKRRESQQWKREIRREV